MSLKPKQSGSGFDVPDGQGLGGIGPVVPRGVTPVDHDPLPARREGKDACVLPASQLSEHQGVTCSSQLDECMHI